MRKSTAQKIHCHNTATQGLLPASEKRRPEGGHIFPSFIDYLCISPLPRYYNVVDGPLQVKNLTTPSDLRSALLICSDPLGGWSNFCLICVVCCIRCVCMFGGSLLIAQSYSSPFPPLLESPIDLQIVLWLSPHHLSSVYG